MNRRAISAGTFAACLLALSFLAGCKQPPPVPPPTRALEPTMLPVAVENRIVTPEQQANAPTPVESK